VTNRTHRPAGERSRTHMATSCRTCPASIYAARSRRPVGTAARGSRDLLGGQIDGCRMFLMTEDLHSYSPVLMLLGI
jgi:hypothetical protein